MGRLTLTFLLFVQHQVGRHDHLAGSQLGLKRGIIVQTRVVGRQVEPFQPVLDTHIIEIIQAHDPGPGPPQDRNDPGEVGGPAHQRFLGVRGQGRLIQGHDGHMLRLIPDPGQPVPEVGVHTFRRRQPPGPGHALYGRAHQDQQDEQVEPRSFPAVIFHRLKGICRCDMTTALIGPVRGVGLSKPKEFRGLL